jgi:hypothetical protein
MLQVEQRLKIPKPRPKEGKLSTSRRGEWRVPAVESFLQEAVDHACMSTMVTCSTLMLSFNTCSPASTQGVQSTISPQLDDRPSVELEFPQ